VEASDRDERVSLSWSSRPLLFANLSDATERAGAKIGPNFVMPGGGLVTLRIARADLTAHLTSSTFCKAGCPLAGGACHVR